jgi:hypothetical protein
VIGYNPFTGPATAGANAQDEPLPTLLSLIVAGVAALGFYVWAERRERRLRQIVLSAEEDAEPARAATRSKPSPLFRAKRAATTDQVDVLTGGITR